MSVFVSRLIADAAHLRPPTLASMFSEEEGQSIMAICRAVTGAGYAIASAWFLPALGRRWRWRMGWIEALGLLLGACWIVFSVSYSKGVAQIHPPVNRRLTSHRTSGSCSRHAAARDTRRIPP